MAGPRRNANRGGRLGLRDEGGPFRENLERCIRHLRLRTNSLNESEKRERIGVFAVVAKGRRWRGGGGGLEWNTSGHCHSRTSQCGIRLQAIIRPMGNKSAPTLLVAALNSANRTNARRFGSEVSERVGNNRSLSPHSEEDLIYVDVRRFTAVQFLCRPSINPSKLACFFVRRWFREDERDGYDSEEEIIGYALAGSA